MVEKQRPRSGSKFSLKPQIAAVISALPPLGYKAPPPLIGHKTMSSDISALRARNYTKAYKTLSVKDWNSYVVFGIQQFASPSKYLMIRDSESEQERNLRLGRYYRLHLEHKAPVDKFLMSQIVGIEAALQTSFPGYFDMSVVEMDEYLRNLDQEDLHDQGEVLNFSPPTELDNSASFQDVEMTNVNEAPVCDKSEEMTMQSPTSTTSVSISLSQETKTGGSTPCTQDFQDGLTSMTKSNPKEDQTRMQMPPTNNPPESTIPRKRSEKSKMATPHDDLTIELKGPSKVSDPVRIEARWAPKDFYALKASTAQMHIRLAPLLSSFNTQHSWMIEWQTDQLAPEQAISPSQVSKFLSIRIVPVSAQKCFYFSFRVNATGKQLVQVLQSKEQKKTKRGENLTLDPSYIPAHQGELVYIGDILLKNAAVTHRSQYLKYLRSEVLPPDVPTFDLKMRHKDPAGNKTPILTVRCGKSVAVAVAQSLSASLNGEGTNPEIFISRLALGANQIAKGEHEKIYKVHHDFLSDVLLIPFTASRQIDLPVIEHLDSGETVTRSPRQWAKSLVDEEGNSLEVDLENGTTDGSAVLITPSASHQQSMQELKKYWQRQNPALAHATKLYADTVLEDPDIPMTVFTRNIETILAKKIKKHTPSVGSVDAATFLSPESSITGTTSKSTKGPIAWKVPLQETMKQQRREYPKASRKASRTNIWELEQQQRIAYLEAQIASMTSATNSRTSSTTEQQSKRSQSRASHTSSQLSGNSPTLTIASAHARLDGIETAVLSIQQMLTNLTTGTSNTSLASASVSVWPSISNSKPAPTMTGIQLFPADGNEQTTTTNLVALSSLSPIMKTRPKRRKPTASPDLRLQYNDSMGSSGEGSF